MGSGTRAVLIAASGLISIAAWAAPGALDPTFGSGGVATAPSAVTATGVALQGDGRIVAVGGSSGGVIVRFDSQGNLDPTFGSGGMVTAAGGSALNLAIQPDGRILAQGTGQLSRYLANGAVDLLYGTAGVANAYGAVDSPNGLAMQPDGRAVAVGFSMAFTLRRYNLDGSVDTTFAGGGTTEPDGSAAAAISTPQGGVVAVGSYTESLSQRLRLARYTATGALEVATTAASPPTAKLTVVQGSWATAIALQPDGRIVVGGYASYNIYQDMFAVWRFLPDGTPDGTFGAGGKVTIPINASSAISAIAIQPDGRIIAAGSTGNGSGPFPVSVSRMALARLLPNGALDPSFGSGGIVTAPFASPGFTSLGALALQPDGKLIATAEGGPQLSVARILLAPDIAYSDPAGDADGDGIPNGVEFAAGRDPAVRDNDVFSDTRLFAMQQYRDFLRREGDAGGIAYWASQVESGARGRSEVVESFIASPEFQGVIAPVVRLYFAYFLRIPDYGGIDYWTRAFRAGNSLATISEYFASSPEFAGIYGGLDNAAFVERVYQNVLGRPSDVGGRAYWTAQLDSGAIGRGEMMIRFSESPEYRSLTASEVLVTIAYVGMLHRSPDPGGFSFWVSYMDDGNSARALIDGFLPSAEYRARFLP